MDETAQLAGFVAAHAILCVSKGKSLTMPLLVVEKEDGNRGKLAPFLFGMLFLVASVAYWYNSTYGVLSGSFAEGS